MFMKRFCMKDYTTDVPSKVLFRAINCPVGFAYAGLFAFALIATPYASFADGLQGGKVGSNNTANLGTEVSSKSNNGPQQEQKNPETPPHEDPVLAELRQISEETSPRKTKKTKAVSPAPNSVMKSTMFGAIPVVTVEADMVGQYFDNEPEIEIQKRVERALEAQGLLSDDFNFTAMSKISLEKLLAVGNYRLNKNGTPKKTIFALSYNPQSGIHDPENQHISTWLQYTAPKNPNRGDLDGYLVVWRAETIQRDYSVAASLYALSEGAVPVMIITLKGLNNY